MKSRNHIRIVCLKNDAVHQKNNHYHSGLIVSGIDNQHREEDTPQPSLAYLSARLQFDNKAQQNQQQFDRRGQTIRVAPNSVRTLEMTETQSRHTPYSGKFPAIETYFKTHDNDTAIKRATIRNMMGPIDFSLDRHKQKKVARTIKHTIDRTVGSNNFTKKKKLKDMESKKLCTLENRSFLQEDFNNFLNNKKQQFIREKQPKTDEEERIRLKRLAIIDPQKEEGQINETSYGQLGLYNFQKNSQVRKRQPTLSSLLQTTPKGVAKARLQKKMFKMTMNQPSQNEFTWSNIPQSSTFSIPH